MSVPVIPTGFPLCETWSGRDPTGVLLSEKLDGVRARWIGELRVFVGRSGVVFSAPEWFTRDLPSIDLDGELWAGRGGLDLVSSVVRSKAGDWSPLRYMVFDAPGHSAGFAGRLAHARKAVAGASHAQCVWHRVCRGARDLDAELERIVGAGGEGLVLRDKATRYVCERGAGYWKLKPIEDAEATVIGHVPGRGRYVGRTGALRVRSADGRVFGLASGMTDSVRRSPPAVGSLVTYSYQGTTAKGLPRCTKYMRVRTVA